MSKPAHMGDEKAATRIGVENKARARSDTFDAAYDAKFRKVTAKTTEDTDELPTF